MLPRPQKAECLANVVGEPRKEEELAVGAHKLDYHLVDFLVQLDAWLLLFALLEPGMKHFTAFTGLLRYGLSMLEGCSRTIHLARLLSLPRLPDRVALPQRRLVCRSSVLLRRPFGIQKVFHKFLDYLNIGDKFVDYFGTRRLGVLADGLVHATVRIVRHVHLECHGRRTDLDYSLHLAGQDDLLVEPEEELDALAVAPARLLLALLPICLDGMQSKE